ncbi:MAG TPA: hypothetical protein VMN60_11905 [Longimicrobiales bacterium]|nr:hypothetical protein [Longimicrobiales bacterium]
MKAMRHLARLLFVIALAGCASGAARPYVTVQAGTAPRLDIDTKLKLVLQRHQYVLVREEQETNLYYETQWRPRTPFDDEQGVGATHAESRIIVRARPRSRETANYTVSFTVENRLRTADAEWVSSAVTDQFGRYARELGGEFTRELAQGIRVR